MFDEQAIGLGAANVECPQLDDVLSVSAQPQPPGTESVERARSKI